MRGSHLSVNRIGETDGEIAGTSDDGAIDATDFAIGGGEATFGEVILRTSRVNKQGKVPKRGSLFEEDSEFSEV